MGLEVASGLYVDCEKDPSESIFDTYICISARVRRAREPEIG